jgi:urease accessory protein
VVTTTIITTTPITITIKRMPTKTETSAVSMAPGYAPLGATALLRLLWLASPALPIGAYAYSRGLEQAVTRGWVHDLASLDQWIRGVLRRQVASLDAPVMLRVLRAARALDCESVTHWNAFLLAHRESREFALEDTQLGASFARLLRDVAGLAPSQLPERPAHATAFGIAAAHYGVDEPAAASAFLFNFAENQITAALKCMSLGQTDGQRLLSRLIDGLPPLIEVTLRAHDDTLGSFAPGLALASALHETQYTRLFRS